MMKTVPNSNTGRILAVVALSLALVTVVVSCRCRNDIGGNADSHQDRDCHVVNQVWLPELGKWVMIDSDSGGFYATDGEGNLLSLQEMRESYIQGKPILYYPEFGEAAGEDCWYYDYMAKNTYWFSCWETIHFDQEPSGGRNAGRYIHLVPEKFKPFGANFRDLVTNDAEQFWAAPKI